MSDWRSLAGCAALQHLNLNHCTTMSDWRSLAGCAALQHQNLDHTNVSDWRSKKIKKIKLHFI